MNKKNLMILIIAIVLIGLGGYIFYNSHVEKRNKGTPPNNLMTTERENYVKKFEEGAKVDKFSGSENNASGYNGVIVENKDIILKSIGMDDFLKLTSKLNVTLNDMNSLYKEMQKFKGDEDIYNYFDSNKVIINEIYGINDSKEFKKLIDSFKFLNNESKKSIIKASIVEDSYKKDESSVSFDVILKSEHNEKKYKITGVRTQNNDYKIHVSI